jgi:GNAT superfamily N-acetyltransferase
MSNLGGGTRTKRGVSVTRISRLGHGLSDDDSQFRVRLAKLSDLEMLVDHRRRMWRDIRRWNLGDLDHSDPDYRTWTRREMKARRWVGFLALSDTGRVVGSGAIWLRPAQPRPGRLSRLNMPYIMSMYTEPKFRGRGVATRLVQAMIEWSSARRYPRIVLHASRFGHSVYARIGFHDSNEMRLDLPIRRIRASSSQSPGKASPRTSGKKGRRLSSPVSTSH